MDKWEKNINFQNPIEKFNEMVYNEISISV